jgi:hypothetical protein
LPDISCQFFLQETVIPPFSSHDTSAVIDLEVRFSGRIESLRSTRPFIERLACGVLNDIQLPTAPLSLPGRFPSSSHTSSRPIQEVILTLKKALLWTACAVALVVVIVAISIPNLLRSRTAANEAVQYGRMHRFSKDLDDAKVVANAALAKPETARQLTAVPRIDRKLIRNAELGLEVADIRTAADKIQQLVERSGGEVDKFETSDYGTFASATMVLRVPANGLDDALAAIRGLALRVTKEQVTARDVTREFYDNEAHLRNLHSEEQQYLAILKQAHTVKDTLEVSQNLSDVRDLIERLQAQIQVMTRDIALSEITLVIEKRADATVVGFHWRPLNSARIASHELLEGLGEWIDWIVAILIKLPLIAAWTLTVAAFVFLFAKIVLWLKKIVTKSK